MRRRDGEKGTEGNLLETNTHEHCSCLGGPGSVMGRNTGQRRAQVKRTPSALSLL